MGKITGFMEIERRDRPYAPVAERIQFYREFIRPLADAEMSQQGAFTFVDEAVPYAEVDAMFEA